MKRYLIDGNNVLCAWKGVARPERAQENEFLKLVKAFLHGNDRATIVFDGPPRSGSYPRVIEVRYSRAQKADAVLIRLIQSAPHPQQLIVVSDDRQVLQAAKGCRVLHAREFLAEAASTQPESEKPGLLSPEERERWLKEFGIKDQ